MKKTGILLVLFMFLGLSAPAVSTALDPPPLPPEGIRVKPPGDDIAPGARQFSGVFRGESYSVSRYANPGQKRQVLLAVVEITNTRAKVIYSLGDHPNQSTGSKASFREFEAMIEEVNGRTELSFSNEKIGWKFYFEGEKLKGVAHAVFWTVHIENMKKVP